MSAPDVQRVKEYLLDLQDRICFIQAHLPAAGLPMRRCGPRVSLERQVQIAIGVLLVLTTIAVAAAATAAQHHRRRPPGRRPRPR